MKEKKRSGEDREGSEGNEGSEGEEEEENKGEGGKRIGRGGIEDAWSAGISLIDPYILTNQR